MYPCPYCRYHLNMYVVRNKEIDMYPMEYILLGRDPKRTDYILSIEAKLSTVSDGPSLRLFFWKLHNTVSSSIERTEQWYHKEPNAFYTTRFWPSLRSELIRSQLYKEPSIPVHLVHSLYELIKPMSVLAGLRRDWKRALETGAEGEMKKIHEAAVGPIVDLERQVVEGKFLEDTYRFNPDLVDKMPGVLTTVDELWARSGRYVAW